MDLNLVMYAYLAFSTAFNMVTGLMVGTFLYTRKSTSIVARLFAIQALLIGVWSGLYFFPFFPESEVLSRISFHMLHMGSTFITILHLHVVTHLIGRSKKFKRLIQFGYCLQTAILIFIPTSLFISGVEPKFDFTYWATPGPLYHVWLLNWCSFMVIATILLFKYYRRASGLKRQQLKYFLVGTLVGLISGSTNFALFYNVNIPPYLNILASIYVLSFAYMVARYRFFNLEANLIRFFQNTAAFVLSALSTYALSFYINQFFEIQYNNLDYALLLTVALCLYHLYVQIISVKFLQRLFRISDNKKFFTTLNNLSSSRRIFQSLRDLEAKLQWRFKEHIKIEDLKVQRFDADFKCKYKELSTHFLKNSYAPPLVFSELELRAEDQGQESPLLEELSKSSFEIFLPIYSESELRAVLLIGPKPFGNPYYEEEIKALEQFGGYITISLSVIDYNQNLHQLVDQKTAELRRANLDLKISNEKLEELDKLKDEFLSIASHELRTPMTIIKGYVDFLRQGDVGSVNTKQKEYLDKIFGSTEKLIKMTNNMLDIKKMESGNFSVCLENFDLVFWLEDIVNDFRVLCREKDIKLSFYNPDKIQTDFNFDKGKLEQVMKNILGNAYKATPEQGNISVTIRDCSKNYQFEVKDNGIGIPKNKHEVIFEKFQQAESALKQNYSGTGLGLNIVKQIVEHFGGTIWVESEGLGKGGSTFKFTLPKKTDIIQE